MTQKGKSAALYARFSRNDSDDESNSISNQRALLERYANEHGFYNTRFYADDGISGTSFERPDFQRMLGDIENGEIGTVIVKDLSRFGRLSAMVGYYTDLYFPQNDIRFIAVGDDVDSEKGDNDFAPFKNIFNEWYNPLSKTLNKSNGSTSTFPCKDVPYLSKRDTGFFLKYLMSISSFENKFTNPSRCANYQISLNFTFNCAILVQGR